MGQAAARSPEVSLREAILGKSAELRLYLFQRWGQVSIYWMLYICDCTESSQQTAMWV